MSDERSDVRHLLLVRHGKAEAYGEDDHARSLAPRGVTDAGTLGSWLLEQAWLPDHAVVSSATRTRQTWQSLGESAGLEITPTVEDGVYNADPDTVLDVLRQVPEDARTVLLLGHNPTVAWLASSLDDGTGDPEALIRVMDGFPPAACAVLEVGVPWSDLADGTCQVLDSWRP